MEQIFIADFVIHSADQYLVVGVHFHFRRWFSEFPSELKYCFDERFVFQGFSGHYGRFGRGFLEVLFHITGRGFAKRNREHTIR